MTVKEFKQHANAKVQVLIPSVDVYDVYHSRTQECYLYAGDALTFRLHERPEWGFAPHPNFFLK